MTAALTLENFSSQVSVGLRVNIGFMAMGLEQYEKEEGGERGRIGKSDVCDGHTETWRDGGWRR